MNRQRISIELRARKIADAGAASPGAFLSIKEIREAIFKVALVELREAIAQEQREGI